MDYIKALKKAGLKATPQRICVLQVLDTHTHPTMDELYANIHANYPNISLATIYKCIGALIDAGLAIEVSIPNQKSKFDIYEKPHIHVVCESCGEIYDIFEDEAPMQRVRKNIEHKIGGKVSKFTLVATIAQCQKCAKFGQISDDRYDFDSINSHDFTQNANFMQNIKINAQES